MKIYLALLALEELWNPFVENMFWLYMIIKTFHYWSRPDNFAISAHPQQFYLMRNSAEKMSVRFAVSFYRGEI